MADRRETEDMADRIQGLIRLATTSDNVAAVASAAWSYLRRPLAVSDRAGASIARVPTGNLGREAAAAALHAARHGGAAPDGPWLVVALDAAEHVGFFAVLDEPPLEDADRALIDVVATLLADQLRRASLATAVIDERARGIKRRLISDASFTRSPSHADAAAVGVRLAATYWPAMLVCEREAPPAGIVAAMEDLVARHSPDSLLVPLDDRALVLLFAGVEGETATLEDIQQAVERTLRALRRGRGGLAARGIVSDAAVPLAEVPHAVRALDRLRRFPRRDRDEAAVLNPRDFALHRLLLEGLSRPAAVEFVRTYVGALAAFDRSHDSHLCETLEVALDYPNRDEAARASYMHRNTFRRHLNQATEIVGIDLHDPEERLALHMALKLRALLQVTQAGDNGAHA